MKKHGLSHTRVHHIWRCMLTRCYAPKTHAFEHYGGRGITVCEEWRNDFMAFYTWSMNHGYKDNLSIDRLNVDGNYEPGNCRWATMKQQANNKRNSKRIRYMGRIANMSELSKQFGIARTTIYTRLECGWSIEKALTTPVKERVKRGAC